MMKYSEVGSAAMPRKSGSLLKAAVAVAIVVAGSTAAHAGRVDFAPAGAEDVLRQLVAQPGANGFLGGPVADSDLPQQIVVNGPDPASLSVAGVSPPGSAIADAPAFSTLTLDTVIDVEGDTGASGEGTFSARLASDVDPESSSSGGGALLEVRFSVAEATAFEASVTATASNPDALLIATLGLVGPTVDQGMAAAVVNEGPNRLTLLPGDYTLMFNGGVVIDGPGDEAEGGFAFSFKPLDDAAPPPGTPIPLPPALWAAGVTLGGLGVARRLRSRRRA